MNLGNRILVLGCSGSGKSTLAEALHERTGLPLFSLDRIWWKADRTHISREEFDRQLGEILSGSRWIIDGDYSRTYEVRIRSCDTVVFLDYDEETCMNGLLERVGKSRPDMPWVDQELDPVLAESVRNFRRDNRPVICALLEKYPEKQICILRTRREADEWLSEIRVAKD